MVLKLELKTRNENVAAPILEVNQKVLHYLCGWNLFSSLLDSFYIQSAYIWCLCMDSDGDLVYFQRVPKNRVMRNLLSQTHLSYFNKSPRFKMFINCLLNFSPLHYKLTFFCFK